MADEARATRARYYTPTCLVVGAPGVKRIPADTWYSDLYMGTAEALAAAGVLSIDMLPPPGRHEINWRPSGFKPERSESWFLVPRYVTIRRAPGGLFRANVTVDADERRRRREADEQRFSNADPAEPQARGAPC